MYICLSWKSKPCIFNIVIYSLLHLQHNISIYRNIGNTSLPSCDLKLTYILPEPEPVRCVGADKAGKNRFRIWRQSGGGGGGVFSCLDPADM